MIHITEGPIKAHICAQITGETTIGITGHTNYRSALESVKVLVQRGALAVTVALDEDAAPDTVVAVDMSRSALIQELRKIGVMVKTARWDGRLGKGIDDLLLSGHKPDIHIVATDPMHDDDSMDRQARDALQAQCDQLERSLLAATRLIEDLRSAPA